MLAVIEVSPVPTTVANPVELIVAAVVSLDAQVTESVMSRVCVGCPPFTYVPSALNCTVCPVSATAAVAGVTWIELKVGDDAQLIRNVPRATNSMQQATAR
jgi:hypothetical protein